MDVFLYVLTISCVLASVVGKDRPKWPDAVSVGFELNSLISDFGMTVKQYFSRAQKSSRWDINGGVSKLYYQEANTSGMYYYFPITTAAGKNETACYFLPMMPQNATADIPSVLPDLERFQFNGDVTVRGVIAENWDMDRGRVSWEEIHNIYVHNNNNSGKIEPVLVQAEFQFYMKSNDVRTKLWTHTNKVFHNYDPREPDPKVWRRPKDVKCKVMDVDATEYLIYLVNMHLGVPTFPILNQLFVDEIDYLKTAYKDRMMKIPFRSSHGISTPRHYENGHEMENMHHSETSGLPQQVKDEGNLPGELPESWDWRKHGAVTGVKDRGICKGGSWAFGAVGAMEGAYFLKTKKLVNMSEQALVDCSWGFGNSGCFSGSPENAFNWIQHNGGLPLAREYGKFQEGHGYCLTIKVKPIAPIKGFVHVPPKPDAVKSALVKHGPLVVGISTPYDLHYYTDGVYQSNDWDGIDQFVVLIGYGSFNGVPYWLIKNSWSVNWGLSGCAMISAENNMLNLLDSVYYADM